MHVPQLALPMLRGGNFVASHAQMLDVVVQLSGPVSEVPVPDDRVCDKDGLRGAFLAEPLGVW